MSHVITFMRMGLFFSDDITANGCISLHDMANTYFAIIRNCLFLQRLRPCGSENSRWGQCVEPFQHIDKTLQIGFLFYKYKCNECIITNNPYIQDIIAQIDQKFPRTFTSTVIPLLFLLWQKDMDFWITIDIK